MPAQTYLFSCLTDNFGVLVHDPGSGATASIDAPEAAPVVLALMIVPLLTGGIGLLMSRGILKRPPLELLRAETG